MSQGLMASNTVFLKYRSIFLFNHNRFVKILQGKGLRMMVAIFGFCQVFLDKSVRQVAFYTGCSCMMGPLRPRSVWVAHDVAIQAGLRVCAKVGQPFSIAKGISTQPKQHSCREDAHERYELP